MTVRTLVMALLFVGVCVTEAAAQEQFRLGPLHAGIGVEEAVAALPDADWELSQLRPSGVTIGARAPGAVLFADQTWDVSVGDTLFWGERNRNAYSFSMELKREIAEARREQCFSHFSSAVLALEPMVGPFGAHEQFRDPRSPLYGNPYGDTMRMERTGQRSVLRTWPDPEWQPVYTFREADAALPYVIEVAMNIIASGGVCELEIRVFRNDEERERRAGAFVAPSALRPVGDELRPPAGATVADVTAARTDLARWRDENHQRQLNAEGYFAVIGDRRNPGGVVRGSWTFAAGNSDFMAEYVEPHMLCGVTFRIVDPEPDEIVYLGETWRPEFAALDAELGGTVSERSVSGRFLADGIAAPAWTATTDLGRFYPARAMSASVSGSVDLGCLVREDLSLRCAVAAQTPEGHGFGLAALRIADHMRAAPTAGDGQPSAGLCVGRTVPFRLR